MIFVAILAAAAVLFVFWIRGLGEGAVTPAVWKAGIALAIAARGRQG